MGITKRKQSLSSSTVFLNPANADKSEQTSSTNIYREAQCTSTKDPRTSNYQRSTSIHRESTNIYRTSIENLMENLSNIHRVSIDVRRDSTNIHQGSTNIHQGSTKIHRESIGVMGRTFIGHLSKICTPRNASAGIAKRNQFCTGPGRGCGLSVQADHRPQFS